MKVLVTGDKGFIGFNLVDFLKEKEFEVQGYDVKDGKDILDLALLRAEMVGSKYVYHCAAISGIQACEENKHHAYEVNVNGTENVVRTAHEMGTKPIIFSSQAVKGGSFYGRLKKVCEALAFKAVVLRLSNVFGGKNYEKKYVAINRFANDDPIKVFHGGKQKRDFIHINAVLEKCLEAQTLPFGVYDVCSGNEIEIGTLALIFSTVRKVPVKYYSQGENQDTKTKNKGV